MSSAPRSEWDVHYERFMGWAPYVLLAVSTVIVAVDQTWPERATTVALSLAAAAWVYGAFTRAGKGVYERQNRARVYFAGFLVIAAGLMLYSLLYFVFAITGLFHASLLRPWAVMFAGLGTASLILNSGLASFSDPSVGSIAIYVIVVTIQTVAIGFGLLGSAKLGEVSDQRLRTVTELEAALVLGEVRQPAKEAVSPRELEVLRLIARGATNRDAAAQLLISERR